MKLDFVIHVFSLLAVSSLAAGAENASIVGWNLSAPAGNATRVGQDYIGFGIEMKSFPDYAGLNETNVFSSYLLSQISSRIGGAPIRIRVGGTSMDNGVYDASQEDAVNFTGNFTECRLHTNITIGRSWMNSFANFNSSLTRYTVQVPLARLNVSNGIEFASACIDSMPSKTGQLDALEIGNEPNLYSSTPTKACNSNYDRPVGYTPQDYAQEWTSYADNLTNSVDALNSTGKKDWFQALALSSSVSNSNWNLSTFWDQLDESGYVKTVSYHYYQGNSSGELKQELMNHTFTVAKMESKFRAPLDAVSPNTPFVIGEVGSAIGNGPTNAALFGTLGDALWTLDFLLYGMTMGVSRVSMQLGTGFLIAPWQPVTKAVHGNYYGIVAGAQFVGSGADGDLQIRELSAGAAAHPDLVAYAGYNGGQLSKVAVINLDYYTGGAVRAKQDVALTGLGADVTGVRVSRLTAPGGATTNETVTWAGVQWTGDNDGSEQQVAEGPVTVDVKDGAPVGNVTVWASEAVLVELLRI